MNKRRIIFEIGIVAILAALFTWNFTRGSGNRNNNRSASISGSSTPAKISKQTNRDLSGNNDTLVVYFSRTRGVYNGPLKVGNTKRVAEFIQEGTNADEYEIIPAKDYPSDYNKTAKQARQEQEDNARPAIKGDLPDLSGYENIFIGAPVWWGEYPMIVRTFLDAEANQLKGKKIIPFTTHEGSGLGNTQSQLESQFPDATILDGFSVRGSDAANSKNDVNDWLKRIGVRK